MLNVAEVIVLAPIDKCLNYFIPFELQPVLKPGFLVKVSLGKNIVHGIVKNILQIEEKDLIYQLRPIISAIYDIPIVNPQMLLFCQWVADYYVSELGAVLDTAIPSAIRKNLPLKLESWIELCEDIDSHSIDGKKFPKQYEALQFLLKQPRLSKKEFIKQFSLNIFSVLLKKNIVSESFQRQERIGLQKAVPPQLSLFDSLTTSATRTLTPDQQKVADTIEQDINSHQFQTHLLQGVAGSGKTEICIHLIQKIIQEQKGSVLYLVPEVVLTTQILEKLRTNLPNIPIYLWYGGLSDGERRDTWMAAVSNSSTVVIGTRSALFVPQNNLRLIVVDEEHELGCYKQTEYPQYNGRDMAIVKAKIHNATCVLGSATPSLETTYNAKIGRYKYNNLPCRYDKQSAAPIKIINLNDERLGAILSRDLINKIESRLAQKEQIILFLNKRGFASTIFCKKCSHIEVCPHCNVPLVYHKAKLLLKCHLCNYQKQFTGQCSFCQSPAIKYRGTGTQRIEQIIRTIFKEASIERLDSDVMNKKYEYIEILKRFEARKIDILIGTQIIAKGLNFPNVTLVGLINPDTTLNLPDFRSNEKTFQLITQIAGRVAGSCNSEVILQTHIPENRILQLARKYAVDTFLNEELALRQSFDYPPFKHLIHIIFEGLDEIQVKDTAQKWAYELKSFLHEKIVNIHGPMPSFQEKINNMYRFSVIIVCLKILSVTAALKDFKNHNKTNKNIKIIIDVDPIQF